MDKFDRADRWAKGWILSNLDVPVPKRRQQKGCSVMIINQTINRPFKVVKLNSANYCNFIDKTLFAWYKSQSCSFKMKYVFLHGNVLSPVSELTQKFFERKRFTEEKIMEWPPSSPDFNLIENL